MAMTKRVVKKSPKLNSVAKQAEASPEAPTIQAPLSPPAALPTPRNLVAEALQRIKMSIEQLELGTYCLEDGKQFFGDMPEAQRTASVKAINDFLQKSHFGLSSLRDEVTIALGGEQNAKPAEKKEKLQLPTITVDVPHVPTPAIIKDDASAADIAKSRDVVGVALRHLAQSQIQAFESEGMLGVLTFFTQLHKDLSARCEAK